MTEVGGISSCGRKPLPVWGHESLLTLLLWAQCVGTRGKWEVTAQKN